MNPAWSLPHAGLGATVALVLALGHLVVLVPRLAEPDAREVGADVVAVKPRYRDLVTPRRVAVTALLAVTAGASSSAVPEPGRGLWWVWAGPVLTLVVVDQATTFLPVRMWRWCLAESVILMVGWVVLAGPPARSATMVVAQGWAVLGWAGLGLAAAAPFWLMWRLTGGIGYGDVRLAAGAGAVSAVLGTDGWLTGLLASALVGVLLAVGTWAVRRVRPSPWGQVFSYGPALWLGPWIALAVSCWSGR